MILYFSGTGNTRHVAESLANLTDDRACFIPETPADSITDVGSRLLFCFPIYSWGVPPIVLDYIASLTESLISEIRRKKIPVVMVSTCGDEVARAPEMFVEAWRKRGVAVSAVWDVIMPNDYVLLPGFDVDNRETEQRKLDACESRIRSLAGKILAGEWEVDVTRGSMPMLKTKIVYPLFKRWGVNARLWKATDKCVSCGKCAEVCPVGNISINQGYPCWDANCVSCTACYHHCPVHAIEYGKITAGKGHYFCPLLPLKKN